MFEEIEIQSLISNTIEIEKKAKLKQPSRFFSKDVKLPDFNIIYVPSVEMAQEVCVHSDGVFPEEKFKKARPNEEEISFQYRKENYEPVTESAWNNAISKVNRIWNERNFTIKWPETPDKFKSFPIEDYFTVDYPQYGSILSYFKSVFTPFKIKDPNAVIAIKPLFIPTKIEREEVVIDQSIPVSPIGIIYESIQVIDFVENSHALIELKEKSWVAHGNTKRKEGKIFEFYDDINIWRITQVGKEIDNTFEFQIFYAHNLKYLPVEKLKGKPKQVEDRILYKSYFSPALPNLNNVLNDSSALQTSKNAHAFPEKWAFVDKCNAPGCTDGKVFTKGEHIDCDHCNGTGNANKGGLLKVHEIKIPDRLDKREMPPTPPFGFEAPDSEILEFTRKEIRDQTIQAFLFINIDISNSNVSGSETALGKQIDREELFSFLLQISNESFDSLMFTIRAISQMRYGIDIEQPMITAPQDFAIRSSKDLTQELSEARTSKIPSVAFKMLLEEYLMSRFSSNIDLKKVTNLVFVTDRVVMFTQTEILMGLNTGTLLKWEAILHDSIEFFITEAIKKDENFMDKDIEEQKNILIQMAKDKAAEIQPSGTEDILALANQ